MFDRARNHPVAKTAIRIQERYGRDAGGNVAGAIAYFGFLSLFPLVLAALSIVGFVLAGNGPLRVRWSQEIAGAFPGIEELIGENFQKLIDLRGWAGVAAFAGLLWTGRGVVVAAETGLGRIFGIRAKENFLKENARRLGTTIALGMLALAGTAVTALAGGLDAEGAAGVLVAIGGLLVGLALDFVLFITTYRVLILKPGPPWRALWPGALFVAIGWTVLKFFGGWYASRTFGNAQSVYGPFAGTVAVLVLLYLAGRLFVYGAELIAVLRDGNEQPEGGGAVQRQDGETTPQEAAARASEGSSHPKTPQERSMVELVTTVAGDVGALVRKEVELAKQEVTEGIAARVKAVAALAVVGVLGLYALGFLAAAGASALDEVVAPWASRLIVAGGFLLIAGLAMLFGVARMKKPPLKPVKTKETIKEDVEWAKAQLKR